MLANEVGEVLDSITSALKTLSALDLETLTATDRLTLAQRCETIDRLNTAVRNDIALSVTRCEIADLGDRPDKALADWLRITPAEARRRIRTTQPLTARTVVSQTLPPLNPPPQRLGAAANSTNNTSASSNDSLPICPNTFKLMKSPQQKPFSLRRPPNYDQTNSPK